MATTPDVRMGANALKPSRTQRTELVDGTNHLAREKKLQHPICAIGADELAICDGQRRNHVVEGDWFNDATLGEKCKACRPLMGL